MELHYTNKLLPETIKVALQQDNENLVYDLLQTIDGINSISNELEAKTVGKLARQLITLKSLKYQLTNELRLKAINALIDSYSQKFMTIPAKIKLLQTLQQTLLKKSLAKLPGLVLDYRPFWTEAIGIVRREKRFEAVASEGLLTDLLGKLVSFLHTARAYIPWHTENYDLIELSATMMRDLRRPVSVEGLLILVNCLDTNFDRYDECLPSWFELWTKLDHNVHWDCCWLTIFARARKHTKTFDWSTTTNFLYSKARLLLQLPTSANSNGAVGIGGDYPHSFPPIYAKFIVCSTDQRKTSLAKLAKLIHSVSLRNSLVVSPEIVTLTAPALIIDNSCSQNIPGIHPTEALVQKNVVDWGLFLQSIRPYFYASNSGAWSSNLSYFFSMFTIQICRHVGRSVAFELLGSTTSIPKLYERPIHLPTLQYSCGILIPYVLENLYGKNPMLSQLCAVCIKNLLGVDPSLGNALVPFLLSALDPEAVSQSHQAPVAFHTLTICFHSLMYPRPILLKFLPNILKFSLPGLDASDARKTMLALGLFSQILSWLPLRTFYVAADINELPPPYLTLIKSTEKCQNFYDRASYQVEWDSLGSYTKEWALMLVEKIFLLLETQDSHVKGAKESPLASSIAQCVGYLFQALPLPSSLCKDDREMREAVENKLIEYFAKSTPLNAVKVCAKIMDSLVFTNPKILERILKILLNDDVLQATLGGEKLAFRLRLAGGACREAQADNISALYDSLILPVLSSALLNNHSEKVVRKALMKFLKDVLKGATSAYPLTILPEYEETDGKVKVICGPNFFENSKCTWHVPSPTSLEKTADLLENIVVKNMLNMRSTMTEILSADSIKNSGDKLKQYQEFFCNGLLQFEKAIRGAAEVLGDDLESGGSTCIVSTGRGEILKTCSGKLQSFYQNFRREMMNTLIYLHDSLKAIPLDNLFSSLSNNSSIHVLWMKVFNAIVLRRMSNLKEVDKTNKYLKYANRMERTSIVKVVYKTMKEQERNCVASDHDLSLLTLSTKDGWLERLRMIDYWRSHDMTTNLLVCNVWLTLVKRHQQLSYTSVRSLLDQSKDSHPIIATMDRLVALCGHEYDVIRTKAENHFKVISSRYGKRLICIARDMMGVLSTQSSAYPTAIGASTIVGMNKIVKRIAADWELTEMFLTTVLNSQTLIGNIPEQDKREMLMSKISEAFVRYTGIWHSVHLPTGKSSSVLVNNVMKTLGVKVDGANTSQDVVEATGIRFQSIAAFILLHLIGNKHVPLTESFWKWSVETLSNANGQPTQALALTALIRLSANYAANSETSPLDRQFLLDTFSIASEDRWQAIIRGISQSRPKQSDDGSSAQWSAGVDHILRCAGFFRIVFERSITAIRGDGGAFSNSFRKEAAGLFLSLCNANIILTDASKESIRIVNVLLSSASHIPSSGDAESRTNNSVRAEIFSALLRSYLSRKTISEELELIFTKYLADNLEKLSYDYAKDWAEAIYFACTGLPNAADGKINFISKYLLDALQQVLAIKGDDLGLNEDGFAREAKQVMLASAIVQADLVACQEYFDDHRIDESVSLVTQTALQIVESPKISLVSSYRSSRLEMASLLRVSVDLTFEQKDHLATIRRSLLERFNTLIMKADTVEAGESQLIESNKDSADKQQVKDLNNCVEFACYWLKFLVRSYPIQEYANYLPDLLLIAIRGSGNGDIEVAKLSHESVLVAASSFLCPQQVIGNDLVSDASTMKSLLSLLKTSLCDASWHVRETILIATTLIMINNWWLMNDESRKCCRDIFVIGTEDVKPEVQNLAKAGMVSYLSTKSYSELSKVAAAYIKNSETFSQREKRKRKIGVDRGLDGDNKIDPMHMKTVIMMSCVVMCFPYDLPSFLPNLVASLSKHLSISSLKDTVVKSIQAFKRTHQDRWEQDFKAKFTREQLEDLQSAGSAHYFS